jgi:hypothetical protein
VGRIIKPVRLWCDPEFANLIKKTAVGKGMNFQDFTTSAVNDPFLFRELEEEAKQSKKKKGGLNSLF